MRSQGRAAKSNSNKRQQILAENRNARKYLETLNILDVAPPTNKATFRTDVAAKFPRATLS
jgi:hypothetical protein